MSSGVIKGVGEQLGQLGKHVVTEVTKTPVKIAGWEIPAETVGGRQKTQKGQQQAQKQAGQFGQGQEINVLEAIRQKDEAERQKKIALARQLLQQFTQTPKQEEPSVREKLEMEEMEKKKQEIEEEKKRAQATLQQPAPKQPRGDLYGVRAKQMGGEVGKNVKAG